MKRLLLMAGVMLAVVTSRAENKAWGDVKTVGVETLLEQFVTPPNEFANHVIWGLEGKVDHKLICSDLDSIRSKGFRSVILEAGYHLPFKYLSEGWFKMIADIVKEAKKRDMKVWIIDEGKYPSGFAGGKFTHERPDLRMQALVTCDTLTVHPDEVLTDYEVGEEVLSAVAVSRSGAPNQTVRVVDHRLSFVAGLDTWDIILVRADYRTGQTRAVDSPTGAKDTRNSQMDYLNPEATRQFIDWTHEQYKRYVGKEFGKTVMGFRGDEPDYSHTPWTPAIVDSFMQRKGYDVTPYLASFFTPAPTWEERRVKADYWDVWSAMFADNFFGQQAAWCEANGLAHVTHLNNEHEMWRCVRAEGDFFRTLSRVQVPGVDAIWNQIWPDTINDFPKLASSVAHVYDKPRAFSESFAAYYSKPTIAEAKYVVDHQLVRGINFFEFMFWLAGSERENWMTAPGMKGLNEYANRMAYVLSQGRPGARVAMYYPTTSHWLGNNTVADHVKALTQVLLKHQRDFDYVNDDAFTEALTVGPGYLENLSGQRYETLIVPTCDVVSADAWRVMQEFVQRGGRLLFWGNAPRYVAGRTYKDMTWVGEIGGAMMEPSDNWTPTVQSAMPRPEVTFRSLTGLVPDTRVLKSGERRRAPMDPTRAMRYLHRQLADGTHVYMLFNEGHAALSLGVSLDCVGRVTLWDATSGTTRPLPATIANNRTELELELSEYESVLLTVCPGDMRLTATEAGAVGDGVTVNTKVLQQAIDQIQQQGGGTLVIPVGNFLTGALFFPRGVNLEIQEGGVVTSTVRHEDFAPIATRFEGIEQVWKPALLNFTDSPDVRIWGQGTVDGKGVEWGQYARGADFMGTKGRPRLICLTRCDGGSIEGLRLRDQASWCLHILYTRGFTVDGIDIRAEHHIPSSDGVDIDSSSDVVVRNCYIEDNDDCISIKAGKDEDGRRVNRPSENILVENCHFGYGHSGVDMGSEVTGGIRNVLVRNCVMEQGSEGGFRFKSQPSRGGVIENITFEDITLNGPSSVFDVIMEWRMVDPKPAYAQLTEMRNVRFVRVKGHCKNAGRISGFTAIPLEGLSFEDCDIRCEQGLWLNNVGEGFSLEGLHIEAKDGDGVHYGKPERAVTR